MRRLAFLAALLMLAVGGCQKHGPARAACAVGKLCLDYGNSGELTSLDPHLIADVWENRVITSFLVGLTDTRAEGTPGPGIATSWETTPDGLTWTFHLRRAQWSDGTPVTAQDFVYSWRRMLDPKTAAQDAYQAYPIKNAQAVSEGKAPLTALGVRAIDPATLEVTLEHPTPMLPVLTASPFLAPVPRWVVEKWGSAWAQPAHFVADGPYIPAEWKLGDHILAVKNPRFYDAANVCIDQVRYYPVTDAVSGERRVRSGELDLNTDIQSNRIAYLRQPGQIPAYVRTHSFIGIVYLEFNTKDVAAFRDVRVRQALSMAIDRDFITQKLLRGGQLPAYRFVPPGVASREDGPRVYWSTWSLAQRQAEARRLLAAAGYGPGHPLKVEIKHRNTADPTLFMPAIQADWKSVGVIASLQPNEVQIAYESYNARDFQVADAGWIGDDDPNFFLFLHRSDTGPQNYGDYRNPVYDGLLNAADREPDVKRRADDMAKAEQVLLDDAPVAPIYFYINKNLVSPDVTGWVDNAFDNHPVRYLCFKDAARRRNASSMGTH